MTGWMRGRGFFAGAVGGLALALLLVGVASFLPPSNNPLQTSLTPQGGPSFGGAASATTTSQALSTSTTTAPAQNAPPGAQNEVVAPASTTTVTAATTTTTVAEGAGPITAPLSAGNASVRSGPTASSGATQRPSSLLTALPGESVASLLATLSPLIIGFLVAALVYGAYARRQDSSS
ncbi:MAG TPA: hypothetical protein VND40_05045 [Nitrososphaerales archaeon]|nr:hypothetical protein [Nitrososphaerales archaeon]